MSFKRKTAASPQSRPVSTGLPSLDDLLGGGLAPSCSLVFTAPDLHSAYGALVQKYFVAQGLAAGEKVCVVASAAWVGECMWMPPTAADDEEELAGSEDKIKIAWRYESMKPFQTTVGATALNPCRTFDLTTRIPPAVVADALASGQLTLVDAEAPARVLARLKDVLDAAAATPLRVCVPSLGAPEWGDLGPQDILRFLHGLRGLLRRHQYACASTSLAATLSGDAYGYGAGWHQRVGWVADGAMTLAAFSADPALAAAFPASHGLVRLHTLPAPQSLVPASDRFSVIRGVGGGGENNIGFKCTRKRLVFETVHLGVEGGVGERRSKPAGKGGKRVGFQNDVYDF
ncbi:Elongator complex protein 4 [Mycena galericulata]|nr:Elongator complex protein 4 [Mycena galericulata]